MISGSLRFLVVRRDNIGDLVCTTPLIAALRAHFPAARICAMVNSYNLAVLQNNPEIDAIYWYTKAGHAGSVMDQLRALFSRVGMIRRLRREHFDYVILATPGYAPRVVQLAGWLGARNVIGYLDGRQDARVTLPVEGDAAGVHEAEAVFRLLQPLGIADAPPAAKVVPDMSLMNQLRERLDLPADRHVYGIHISARKPSQRWPVERFAELIGHLHKSQPEARFVLFWAPGSEQNLQHPGDDEKAAALMSLLQDLPVHACATSQLAELIAGLALCDQVICSDGGAMHLAAGLGKPIVALFGKSDAQHWHPWGVPHVVLQPPSLDVKDVSVEQVLAALERL